MGSGLLLQFLIIIFPLPVGLWLALLKFILKSTKWYPWFAQNFFNNCKSNFSLMPLTSISYTFTSFYSSYYFCLNKATLSEFSVFWTSFSFFFRVIFFCAGESDFFYLFFICSSIAYYYSFNYYSWSYFFFSSFSISSLDFSWIAFPILNSAL